MREMTTKLDEAQFHALQQRAHDEGVTVVDLMRRAIAALLADYPVQRALEARGIRVLCDVRYGHATSLQTLDLYLPPEPRPQPQPVVVLIHGGSWAKGDKSSRRLVELAGRLAQAGFVCTSVNYQLVGQGRPSWPGCVLDIKRAIQFVRRCAADYGVDPCGVILYGGSWGGYLAAVVAATGDWTLVPESVDKAESASAQMLVLMNPLLDPLAQIGLAKLAPLFGETVEPEAVTPAALVRADHPPTLLLRGADDRLAPEYAARYIAALGEQGVLSEERVLAGEGHLVSLDTIVASVHEITQRCFAVHETGTGGV
jgi:acetyl esterase